MPVRLYADLPYCLAYGWPAWVSGEAPADTNAIESLWHRDLVGVIDSIDSLRAGVVDALTPQQRAAKRAAVSCYRSQLSIGGFGFRELMQRGDSFNYEVHWRVTA